ncbi:MAG: cysteine desulfurase family protein [Nanoarchaeota archaeon]
MGKIIYLDNAATTRVKEEVVRVMQEYLVKEYGNPSSLHQSGENAKKAVNGARDKLAKEINANSREIIFTSGGTESNNLAILGAAGAYPNKKKIIVGSAEHPSVLETCEFLEKKNYDIIKIPADKDGIIRISELETEIKKNCKEILLASFMHVNNITGTIQDVARIGKICRENNVFFHSDGAQSFGKLEIDVKKMSIDLFSASAHKIGGPKGIGFLYIKEGIKINPIIFGGGQERGLRSGTENVPAIAGFAKALEISRRTDKKKILKLRDKIILELEKIGGEISGSKEKRIYNNIAVSFPEIESEALVIYLSQKKIYVSAGSACDSNKEFEKAAHDEKELIRITLNEDLSYKDAEYLINEIKKAVKIFSLK